MKTCIDLLGIFGLIVKVAIIVSCSAPNPENKMVIPLMTISTGSVGAGHFNICSSIADWANAQVAGYPITAVPGSGGIGNPIRVARGNADIGVSFGPFLKMAFEGKSAPYEQAYPNLRAICSLTTNVQHFLVPRDIDVDFLEELFEKNVGIKIATGFPGTSDDFILQLLFHEMGVKKEDIRKGGGTITQIGTSGRVDLWKDRHINALHSSIEYPSAAITEAMASRKGKLLGLKESTRERIADKYGFETSAIPVRTYPNQNDSVPTLELTTVIFTTDTARADAIYLLTKTIAENQDNLKKSYGAFKKWQADEMWKKVGIPLHEGAKVYYMERGWINDEKEKSSISE